jgi:hypothetical protein
MCPLLSPRDFFRISGSPESPRLYCRTSSRFLLKRSKILKRRVRNGVGWDVDPGTWGGEGGRTSRSRAPMVSYPKVEQNINLNYFKSCKSTADCSKKSQISENKIRECHFPLTHLIF